jgi:hypothetical protein
VFSVKNMRDFLTWETRYILLLWLGVLSLIPFDICSMDSRFLNENENKFSLVHSIVNVCTLYTADPGPSRVAASLCLSSLLTRPDMDSTYLSTFIKWTVVEISEWCSSVSLSDNSFRLIGVLHCLGQIFKHGHRNRLSMYATEVLTPCLSAFVKADNTLIRKLLSKLFQRIAMTFLPPRIASWRYTRGKRCLNASLGDMTHLNSVVHADVDNDCEVTDEVLSFELESILENLLILIGDKDTVVRWSAAKGIGRITMLLSKSSADDIVEAVIESFCEIGADANWHGGCLSLAELSRRGLLLPERLSEVVPFIERAILFDLLRGQHSVGSHVRDAACYVCWSFSRAYSPLIMKSFSRQLSESMLITALYDREVNCRRAAAAAFQENVGRQGNENFPFGIDVITVADYFSLGNRANAYLEVAPIVASMCDSFNKCLLNHLCSTKIAHWDEEIRVLSSKAIAKLSVINPALSLEKLKELVETCTSNQLSLRHGSISAVSEILFSLVSHGVSIPKDILERITNISLNIERARLYRGKGGELIRQAVCLLIRSISRSQIPINGKMQFTMVESLNEHLRQPFEALQQLASDALRNVMFTYFSGPIYPPSEKLLALTVLKYINGLKTDENVAVTRGYAKALGSLPLRLVCYSSNMFENVLNALNDASSTNKLIGGEYDAATCRNAVESVTELAERLCDSGGVEFTHSQFLSCLKLLWRACDDYSVDKRGDTGSWSRVAGLLGIERLIYAAYRRVRRSSVKVICASNLQSGHVFLGSCGESIVLKVDAISVDNVVLCVSFPVQSTGDIKSVHDMTSYANERVVILRKNADVHVSLSSEISTPVWVSADQVSKSLSLVLKQLSEKLDQVRETAGKIFHRMTFHSSLRNCKEKFLFQFALKGNDTSIINWVNPDCVFPVVIEMMMSPFFLSAVLSGLTVSIGGITETVARASLRAFLKFCESQQNSINKQWFFNELRGGLISLFSDNKKNDRVLCPLIKFVDLMIRNGMLDFEPTCWTNDTFLVRLLELLVSEMRDTSNIFKIDLCLELLVLLMAFNNEIVRYLSLNTLIRNIGHKYPRIRKSILFYMQKIFLSIICCNSQDAPNSFIF